MDSFDVTSEIAWQNGVELLRQGKVAEAVTQLAAFVKAHPASFEGHNFLGVALAQTGRNPEAISCLMKATRLNPQNAQAQYNLGRVYVRAERPDRARAAFQAALQIDPNYAAAQQALAAVPVPPPVAPAPAAPFAAASLAAASSATRPQAQMPGAAAPLMATPAGASVVSQAAPLQTQSTPPAPAKPSALDKIREGLAPANAAEAEAGVTAVDLAKAFGAGAVASIIGALLWYGFVMVTHFQIGIVAAGVGILVGLGVQMGASGKSGMSVALLGASMAAIAMMSGELLIINGILQKAGADVQLTNITDVFTVDPIFTVFFGIGVWRAWQTNAE